MKRFIFIVVGLSLSVLLFQNFNNLVGWVKNSNLTWNKKTSIIGSVISMQQQVVRGWVADTLNPDAQVAVRILIDGQLGGQILANEAMPEVSSAFCGACETGFTFSIPVNFYDGKIHQLQIFGQSSAGGTVEVQSLQFVLGGNGIVNVVSGVGHDYLFGGNAPDTISGGEGNDEIHGGPENDQLQGNMGNDIIYGDAGNDTLLGGKDNDAIYGGAGDDAIYGDLGDDYLAGGDGNDMYYYSAGNGSDTIDDMSGINTLTCTGVTGYIEKNSPDAVLRFPNGLIIFKGNTLSTMRFVGCMGSN